MKIKHFQGYGSVNAEKIDDCIIDTNYDGACRKITIKVTGDHEYGLKRDNDEYGIYNWLVKKFVRGYDASDVLTYTTQDGYEKINGLLEEYCTYRIFLKEKDRKAV